MLRIKILIAIIAHGLWTVATVKSEESMAKSSEKMADHLEALAIVDRDLANNMALAFMKSFDAGDGETTVQDLGLDSDPAVWMAIHAGDDEYFKRVASARERIRAIALS